MKRIAVYAGSFDPITNGHMWMITEGSRLFDKLIILVATNPNKKYCFPVNERMDMVLDALEDSVIYRKVYPHIEKLEEEYTIKKAKKLKAQYLLRGIRTVSDFDYERAVRLVNTDIESKIQTVFLMPPRNLAEISSSLVRGLVGLDGWEELISKYVPENVVDVYRKKLYPKLY